MTKNVKEPVHTIKTTTAEHPLIPPRYQHPAAIALMYFCLIIFFHSIVFEGKTYESADSIASHSWETLAKDAEAEGIFPLWNPYIFCGMPGYASLTFTGHRSFDLTTFNFGNMRLLFAYIFIEQKNGSWLFFYLLYGIGVYLLPFRNFEINPLH